MYNTGDSELQQLYKTDRNPSQEGRYQQLLKAQGLNESDIGRGGNAADASILSPTGDVIGGANLIRNAQKFLDFQKKANEPVVQQLQGSKTDLESKYSALVDSIKGAGKVAGDKQTLATSNELGRRGITNDSGLYQQEQANASLPVQTAIASQLANTGLAQSGDLRQLALQIAQLQAGAPSEAIGGALNYGNQVQSANQFQQNLALQQSQSQADNDYRNRALAAQSKPESPYATLSEGQTLYDILGGRALYKNDKTYKATGGGGGGGNSGW